MPEFKPLIGKVAAGTPLSEDEARAAFEIMMSGEATPSQIGGFLMALRVRGETVEEISGAVSVMRAKMLKVDAPDDAIDIVGTGGDASGSVNISTASAIVAAGAGVHVAKHGNRALSSRSGAADVLAALGINLEIGPETIADCVRQAGVGFMFAPAHHAAMKFVGPSRVELGTRTIFNLLGPLANPAGVKRQLLGVFAAEWVEPLAHVLARLGTEKAWVAHGSDGLDEITVTGPTTVAELSGGTVRTFEISPADVGLDTHPANALKGGTAEENAAALRGVLSGHKNAYRDAVLMNAGAGIFIAGQAASFGDGVIRAAQAIDSGAAAGALEKLVAVSNG
ncbi:Anthranilate phosphoribosyltransferase [Hartmannibacter diazotrophicus]|uniref:Anthranilate phosphoribosyltransferase n=1 Tax=Hartmannibacter diazotrophicus TaxID=1482074 RepID=A0A2C9D449_9HYPH|nr:anthranilate phosphoribosyltransferase [Hartmannibacter diazotrophicus]SON55056.1 Anthranilate phosphoribosyltransferase [Hartmannibacter diazotrophicus]